jgi:hypothetical protein
MDTLKATERFTWIFNGYKAIKEPKYRYADVKVLHDYLDELHQLKNYLNDKSCSDLINSLSQIINHIDGLADSDDNRWRNVTERGLNKAIQPVVKKPRHTVEFPFEWIDPESGQSCFINDGYWDARNFMVMDAVGYMMILKEGGNSLPEERIFIFKDLKSIANRESLLSKISGNDLQVTNFSTNTRWINFKDNDFRQFTNQDYSSNQIFNMLHSTSKVEFKLVYPVRMEKGKKLEENVYKMNFLSRPFEFGYIDKGLRKDGFVRSREYTVTFNTMLGELFVHNLLSEDYDWIDSKFYKLPSHAQLFYRHFLLHMDYVSLPLNLETIINRLNLQDKNITNQIRTIEENIFKPLIEHGFITSYEKVFNGLMELKYIIKRPPKSSKDKN